MMHGDPVAREDQWEAEGIELRKCECGTAEVEAVPDRDVGMRCAGCKRTIVSPREDA
jgi:hypothetical protein